MAKKNDNETELVQRTQRRIRAHDPLQAKIEWQNILGAAMATGQTWRSSGWQTASNTRPQRSNDPLLSTPLDLIGDKVQHLYGRLTVREFAATVRTLERERIGLESPELVEKIDLLQDFNNRWLPSSQMAALGDDLTFRRIICGWASARAWLPSDPELARRYGGLVLDRDLNTRLVVDPQNTNQDLQSHEFLIEVYAMSEAEVNRQFETALKAKDRWPLKSETPMGTLVASDQWIDKSLKQRATGSAGSTTKGFVVFRIFDEWHTKLDVCILKPEYRDDKGQPQEPEWFHVWPLPGQSNDWPYGCMRVKLDCYKVVNRWTSDGLVLRLAPQQTVANLVYRMDLRNAYTQGLARIIVTKGALEPGGAERLRSNKPFEVVGVNRGYPANAAVNVLTMPRYDPATARLLQISMEATGRTAGTGGPLAGEPSSREPAAGYIERVHQALVPYEPVVTQDQSRLELWMRETNQAAARFHGRTSPAKLCIFLFGEHHTHLVSGAGRTARVKRVLDSGGVYFHMNDDAFRPQPVEEVKQELWMAVKAGRFDFTNPKQKTEFSQSWFLRTGQEWTPGDRRFYNEAQHIVSLALHGEEPPVGPGDPLAWILHAVKFYSGVSRSRRYTPDQRAALQRLKGRVTDAMDLEAAEQAAIGMRNSASLEQGLGGPAGATPATPGATAPQPLLAGNAP